jgi:hypothetical protein
MTTGKVSKITDNISLQFSGNPQFLEILYWDSIPFN